MHLGVRGLEEEGADHLAALVDDDLARYVPRHAGGPACGVLAVAGLKGADLERRGFVLRTLAA